MRLLLFVDQRKHGNQCNTHWEKQTNINDGGINRELTEILTQFYMNEV